MEKTFNQSGSVCPVAYIAKSKQRVKQYGDTVYLKDGDEFEIELFNPTQTKVTARIEINNTKIGPGLVLRPGERVFLDRYMQEARKFLFETYVVNGESKEVAKAIAKNGDVVIKFHKEKTLHDNYNLGHLRSRSIYDNPGVYGSGISNISSSSSNYSGGQITTLGLNNGITFSNTSTFVAGASTPTISTFTSQVQPDSLDFLDVDLERSVEDAPEEKFRGILSASPSRGATKKLSMSKSIPTKEIETGRVEKGSHSNTVFDADYSSFEDNYTWIVEWKLLPESRKEITSDDLVQYCTSCGRKRKKGEVYCPKDGNKF